MKLLTINVNHGDIAYIFLKTIVEHSGAQKVSFQPDCLGMQLACIEFARNVCNLPLATSKEFDPNTKDAIIDLMADQKSIANMGGTLRLGNYDCLITPNTLAHRAYKEDLVKERHRHRYEFNNEYLDLLKEHGMVFSGINEKTNLVEIIELPACKHFIACQFHPEFKSRPTNPHPLFVSFIKASINNK